MQKNAYQSEIFQNRLKKRFIHLLKWAKRSEIFAFRVYDRDIPEVPVGLDIYFKHNGLKKLPAKDCEVEKYSSENAVIVIFLYKKRPYEKSVKEENEWLSCIIDGASEILNIPNERIFLKMRERQKGLSQYEKIKSLNNRMIVQEHNCLFYINPQDYLDTGLFLDHRPSRLKIFKESKGKKVLNLYSYTGSFSVHSLAGGAKEVTSVDLSNTYLNWSKENFALNKLNLKNAKFIKSCAIKFLENAKYKKEKWDIIICDPPTFSNSKQAETFDVNRDWKSLCLLCLAVLEKNGIFYFSSNSLTLKFDIESLHIAIEKDDSLRPILKNLKIKDISKQSIPEDFRNKKIHKMWEFKF